MLCALGNRWMVRCRLMGLQGGVRLKRGRTSARGPGVDFPSELSGSRINNLRLKFPVEFLGGFHHLRLSHRRIFHLTC